MSAGLRFFSKLLSEGAPLTFSDDYGIERDLFESREEKKVFDTVVSYLDRYGTLPSIDVASVDSNVKLDPPTDDPIDYWIDVLKTDNRKRILTNTLADVHDILTEGDIDNAEAIVKEYLTKIALNSADKKLVDFSEVATEVLRKFKELRMATGLLGVTYGFPYLDKTTRGAQPGDMVVIAGRPKTGKTWTMVHMANEAYNTGAIPLIITTEQTHIQLTERIACMRAGINARHATLGRMSDRDAKKVQAVIMETAKLREKQPFHIYKAGFRTYVRDISILIKELRPTCVYCDGAYLLRSSSRSQKTNERVSNSAEDLKSLARDAEVPIFATYQFNREGSGKGHIYQSDAVEQLASVLFGLTELPAEKYTTHTRYFLFKELQLIYGRDGEKGSIRVKFDTRSSRHEEDEVLTGYIEEVEGEGDEAGSSEETSEDIWGKGM